MERAVNSYGKRFQVPLKTMQLWCFRERPTRSSNSHWQSLLKKKNLASSDHMLGQGGLWPVYMGNSMKSRCEFKAHWPFRNSVRTCGFSRVALESLHL